MRGSYIEEVRGLKLDWLELGPNVNAWVDHRDLKTGKKQRRKRIYTCFPGISY
jgi:hypothetical protein